MAKKSKDVYGSDGQTNLLTFDPERLVLVTDEMSPLYDDRVNLPVDDALARNIDYQGVLEPIAIAKNPETGAAEVVFGRQRVKAARLANEWRHARGEAPLLVPAVVYQGKRQSALDAIASENEARRADSPIGRAEKMRRHRAMGYGDDQIAVIYNCGVETVRATLSLLESPAAVREAVDAGDITVTQARQLSKLKPDEQREKVRDLVKAGEGVKPHERARRQREVLASDKPRTRGRREIEARLAVANGLYADALRWVLGLDDEPQATPAAEQQEVA
ncbi:MAG: hypothetical protein E2576_14405 [Alcaligenaceae bacterium]|nr:hypothetical protein [Alcaligenaceae bacterium SAGV5]MPS50428.1 hypothetical protein [Alcaligenaceae bacterium SAGV3]MPT57911.1 hypothetical protein [Alcaligenaceae bacterium]